MKENSLTNTYSDRAARAVIFGAATDPATHAPVNFRIKSRVNEVLLEGWHFINCERYDDALKNASKATKLDPSNNAEVLALSAVACVKVEAFVEAMNFARAAFKIDPSLRNALILAAPLRSLGLFAEGRSVLENALQSAKAPDDIAALHYNLAINWAHDRALLPAVSLSKVQAHINEAVTVSPERAKNGQLVLAATMNYCDLFPASRGVLQDALQSTTMEDSFKAEYHLSLASAFGLDPAVPELIAFKNALRHCWEVLRLNPAASEECSYLMSRIGLLYGHYTPENWTNFECRHKWYGGSIIPSHQHWDGEDLTGKTLLFEFEGGLGDTVHFGRYFRAIKARVAAFKGARLIAALDPRQERLRPLMEACGALDEIISIKEWHVRSLPPFDVALPPMSLPRVCGTTIENIPPADWITKPSEHKQLRARARTSGAGLKVGLAWAATEVKRSFPLSAFAGLAEIPNVKLFGLQRGDGAEQLACAGFPIINIEEPENDVLDTAASLLEMDVLITADTFTCHLAGSLEVKTFTLLPYSPDWRWMFHRTDSPWYPTMRLFRQSKPMEWSEPIQQVIEAVRVLAIQKMNTAGPRGL